MGTQLVAGSEIFDSFSDRSMAAEIDWHLRELIMPTGQTLATADSPDARDRRRLFAAIARGVIEHLRENPEALRVVFTSVPGPLGVGDFAAHVQVDAQDVPTR